MADLIKKITLPDGKTYEIADAVARQAISAATISADWNQNDPDKLDYVKNRTHWSEPSDELFFSMNGFGGIDMSDNGLTAQLHMLSDDDAIAVQQIVSDYSVYTYTCEINGAEIPLTAVPQYSEGEFVGVQISNYPELPSDAQPEDAPADYVQFTLASVMGVTAIVFGTAISDLTECWLSVYSANFHQLNPNYIPTGYGLIIDENNKISVEDEIITAAATKGILTIQKNGTDVAEFYGYKDVTANIEVPTKLSDLTNDVGFTTDVNTTYEFTGGTNKVTVKPSDANAYDVTVTPHIENNITGSGTSGAIAKFNSNNTITSGPAFGTDTTKYLRNDGKWVSPPNDNTDVKVQQDYVDNATLYPLLLAGSAKENNTNNKGAQSTKFSNKIYAHPYNGQIISTGLQVADVTKTVIQNDSLPNLVVPAEPKSLYESPIPKYLWHDITAFGHVTGFPTQEYTTDGTNWTTEPCTSALFDERDDVTNLIIADTGRCGCRWTWTSGIQYSQIQWIQFCSAYSSPVASVTILIETSTNGQTWTTRHQSVNTYSGKPYWCYIGDIETHSQLRISITKDPTETTRSYRLSTIKALTARLGDQGRGSEIEYPYKWNSQGTIYPWVASQQDLGTAGTHWRTLYVDKIEGAALTAETTKGKLTIQQNGTQVAEFQGNADTTANITVPTKVSDLTNDSNFISTVTSSDIDGVIDIAHGGTGADNVAAARTNLGLGTAALKNATTTAPSGSSTDDTIPTSAAVWSAISAGITANDAMVFKGIVYKNADLPATHYQGWTYKVGTAGTYANTKCEIGDMLICITDGTSADNSHWTVLQANLDGAVTGPSSAASNNVAVFNGTTGKLIKDSGFTIGASVPANAKFTDEDTTYTFTGGVNSFTATPSKGSAQTVTITPSVSLDDLIDDAEAFQSDWQENDNTSRSYIKNRTHWQEERDYAETIITAKDIFAYQMKMTSSSTAPTPASLAFNSFGISKQLEYPLAQLKNTISVYINGTYYTGTQSSSSSTSKTYNIETNPYEINVISIQSDGTGSYGWKPIGHVQSSTVDKWTPPAGTQWEQITKTQSGSFYVYEWIANITQFSSIFNNINSFKIVLQYNTPSTAYHQLDANYVPVDNDTIVINDEGKIAVTADAALTDRYVNKASFASISSSGTQMTLTRAGSDEATITATIPYATTTRYGVTMMSNSTSSTSQTNAASSYAVKIAYDKAVEALNKTVTIVRIDETEIDNMFT